MWPLRVAQGCEWGWPRPVLHFFHVCCARGGGRRHDASIALAPARAHAALALLPPAGLQSSFPGVGPAAVGGARPSHRARAAARHAAGGGGGLLQLVLQREARDRMLDAALDVGRGHRSHTAAQGAAAGAPVRARAPMQQCSRRLLHGGVLGGGAPGAAAPRRRRGGVRGGGELARHGVPVAAPAHLGRRGRIRCTGSAPPRPRAVAARGAPGHGASSTRKKRARRVLVAAAARQMVEARRRARARWRRAARRVMAQARREKRACSVLVAALRRLVRRRARRRRGVA